MATRRRTTSPRRATGRGSGSSRRRSSSGPSISAPRIDPEVVRTITGIAFLILGVITLIALLLPGEGRLTDWWRNAVVPWFGASRRLLPVVLIGIGLYIPRRVADGRWVAGTLAILLSFVAFVGLVGLVDPSKAGRIGKALSDVMPRLVTGPGSAAILLIVCVGSLLFAFNRPVQWLLDHGLRLGRTIVPTRSEPAEASTNSRTADARPEPTPARSNGRTGAEAVQTELPTPTPSAVPMSGTVWAGLPRGEAIPTRAGAATAPSAVATEEPPRARPVGSDLLDDDSTDQTEALHAIPWSLPTVDLLDDRPEVTAGKGVDHAKNIGIIELKLRSFGIEATVSAVNSGPVVTQYEVKPDATVKLSRIEGLADDLAMALAARSIRIEAPIPGKAVVGIEIPNVRSETVGFRSLIDDSDMLSATSRLTFALGRDVSGKGYAVDLAKMPHLLVAGATGSGKSVCVNALITSLLMHARPWEVRLILIDLKRVELAPYDKLPHLLQHVIVEPHEAKAALNWAVHQMEERYKLLASRTVRNITGYNALPDLPEAERLPYLVLIIDELADLIMREGRKVEDPVVKIAQKARAVGIHLVLATQRPSVNVVTGLIKANVPSRIAFAMSSNVDSRTVLDQPGAEDLIGRGDMLYQPVDLPRPVRLQGVFVSDDEVGKVTAHWRAQTGSRSFYDESVFAFIDGEDGGNGGQFAWLAAMAEDDMVVQAAELVTRTGRASTSNLQTKLKVGFSRASRLMDELERYGIIGPQDPRNPATPRIVYGPDNWLRSHDDIDDPGD